MILKYYLNKKNIQESRETLIRIDILRLRNDGSDSFG